MDMDIDMF